MPAHPVQQSATWNARAPTTPQKAIADASLSETRALTSFVASHTPKKMPTAVKIPCHARTKGPRCRFGSRSMVITRVSALAPVTLLELLTRPAPARIVATDLLVGRTGRRRRLVPVRAQV